MPKAKKHINNQFIRDGLSEHKMTQAELARATGIDAHKLNKSIKDRRGVSGDEYRAIASVFAAKKAGMPSVNPSLTPPVLTESPVSASVEGDMNREGGLWDVIGDLTRRVAKLERQHEGEAEKPATGPQKRRKR